MQDVPISCWFLAFSPARDVVLVFGVYLNYFVFVFNGSDLFAVAGRDKDATWRTLGTLCRELDWSPRRLLHELQGGLRYRTIPEGREIDWHDPNVRRWLNLEASEVTFYDEKLAKERSRGLVISLGQVTIGIEVLPPERAGRR